MLADRRIRSRLCAHSQIVTPCCAPSTWPSRNSRMRKRGADHSRYAIWCFSHLRHACAEPPAPIGTAPYVRETDHGRRPHRKSMTPPLVRPTHAVVAELALCRKRFLSNVDRDDTPSSRLSKDCIQISKPDWTSRRTYAPHTSRFRLFSLPRMPAFAQAESLT